VSLSLAASDATDFGPIGPRWFPPSQLYRFFFKNQYFAKSLIESDYFGLCVVTSGAIGQPLANDGSFAPAAARDQRHHDVAAFAMVRSAS